MLSAQAVLTGYARLEADTFRPGPPASNKPRRFFPGMTPRWDSQPVQGISSLRQGAEGTFWALSDNGFGTKANSATYILCIYQLAIHWKTAAGGSGTVELLQTVELSDPGEKAGFRIKHRRTPERRLTGADFDPESLVLDADGTFWIGDEFGPYLLHFSRTGVLLGAPVSAVLTEDGVQTQLRAPGRPGKAAPNVAASRGFEGMALDSRTGYLYLLLENAPQGSAPGWVPVFQYAPGWPTVRSTKWRYPLGDDGYSIGGMAFWPQRSSFLIIERDWGHGPLARVKRITSWRPELGLAVKNRVADLMDISDPDGLGGLGNRFTMPYITIESVLPLDGETLVICNDNNFPATGGRGTSARDATEFIRIRVPAFDALEQDPNQH